MGVGPDKMEPRMPPMASMIHDMDCRSLAPFAGSSRDISTIFASQAGPLYSVAGRGQHEPSKKAKKYTKKTSKIVKKLTKLILIINNNYE